MDISTFSQNLYAALDKKCISSQFRSKVVYPKGTEPKKKSVIDEAIARNAMDAPEIKAKFEAAYKKKATPFAKEKAIQADLNKIATKLAINPHLEIGNDFVIDHPTMKQAIRDVKMEVCGSCLSVNCALKQMISKSMQMKSRIQWQEFATGSRQKMTKGLVIKPLPNQPDLKSCAL